MSDKISAFDPNRDKYKAGSDPGEGDDIPCVKCGLAWLDTGLECTNCGHDNYESVMGRPFGSIEKKPHMGLNEALQRLGDGEHDDYSVAHDALGEIISLRMALHQAGAMIIQNRPIDALSVINMAIKEQTP